MSTKEEDFQRMMTDARGRQRRIRAPVRIADIVNRLLARRGYAQLEQGSQWEDAWRETAGDVLARDSRPGRMNRGVLEIIVRNSTSLQELTFRKRSILQKLKAVTGNDEIGDLRFRVGEID
jgi:predicted nucleic acid-binding Zn ribbon protein